MCDVTCPYRRVSQQGKIHAIDVVSIFFLQAKDAQLQRMRSLMDALEREMQRVRDEANAELAA